MHFHCRSFFNSHFFQRTKEKKRKETVATQKQVNSLKRLFVQILCVCVCVCERVCVFLPYPRFRGQIFVFIWLKGECVYLFFVCAYACVRHFGLIPLEVFGSDHQRTRMSVPYRQQTRDCPPEEN